MPHFERFSISFCSCNTNSNVIDQLMKVQNSSQFLFCVHNVYLSVLKMDLDLMLSLQEWIRIKGIKILWNFSVKYFLCYARVVVNDTITVMKLAHYRLLISNRLKPTYYTGRGRTWQSMTDAWRNHSLEDHTFKPRY